MNVRWLMPSWRAIPAARTSPCGNSGTMAFSTVDRKEVRVALASRQRFLAITHEQFVEVGVGAHHRRFADRLRENQLVARCAEFDLAAEERAHLLRLLRARVHEAHALRTEYARRGCRRMRTTRGKPEFGLVAIDVAAHADVSQVEAEMPTVDALLRDALVAERRCSAPCAVRRRTASPTWRRRNRGARTRATRSFARGEIRVVRRRARRRSR